MSWQQLVYVVDCGASGTVARFGLAVAFANDRFPGGTTIVNLSGALMFCMLWGAFKVQVTAMVAEQGRWSVSSGHVPGHYFGLTLGRLFRLGLS